MATSLLLDLDHQRKVALAAAREIAERAAAGEERDEDEQAYVRANADYDRISKMMADERKRLKDEAESAEAFEAAARNAHKVPEGEAPKSSWLDDLRAALNDKEQRKAGATQRLPEVSRVPAIRSTMYPEYRTSTTTTGDHTVPVTLAESLFRKLFDDSTILSSGVRILRTGSGSQIKFPRLTALGKLSTQTKARVAEGGTILKDADPAFDEVVLDAYKYAQIMQTTRELISDSVIDVEALLGELLGRNMANYLGYDLTLGSGSSQPLGLVPAVPSGNLVTSATGKVGAIENCDQLLDIIWKLPPTYRRNGKFLMNDATVLTLRKFKIASEGNHYAIETGNADGVPDRLMGYPLLTDPNIATQALNAKSIIFADMSMFWVRLVADMRVEWSTEYAWDTDLVSVKAVLRADSDTIDDTALAGFVGAAS